jgi:dihydroorotate dehydrogenase
MTTSNNKRKVKDININYNEFAEEVFTLNIGCPHCKKTISISLAKLELEGAKQK